MMDIPKVKLPFLEIIITRINKERNHALLEDKLSKIGDLWFQGPARTHCIKIQQFIGFRGFKGMQI
jgi:hypothetical protein